MTFTVMRNMIIDDDFGGDTKYDDDDDIDIDIILFEATLMIVKHPCMMVGQSVVPTLIHSGCDPGMLLLVSEKIKNYDYADDCELFTMILTCCTIVHNDCDLLYHCS